MTGAPDDPDGDSPEDAPKSGPERADGGGGDSDDLTPAVVRVADEDSPTDSDAHDEEFPSETRGSDEPPAGTSDSEDTSEGTPNGEGTADETRGEEPGPLAGDEMAFTEPDVPDESESADASTASVTVDHWPALEPTIVPVESGSVEPVDNGGTGRQLGEDEAPEDNPEEYTVAETVTPGDEESDADEEFPTVPENPDTPPENEPLLGGGGTAPDDEELPLADHIEEMVFRAAIIVGVAGAVSVLLFPFGDTLINIIWDHVIPGATAAGGQGVRPHLYAPLDLVITQFKVASLAGIIVALPVLVYETYAFMRPGLYPNERRYYLAAIPTSLILAVVGVLFAFFIVLPASFGYLIGYSNYVANSALALTSTFSMILIVMGYLAIVFQLPLFMMLAVMMRLTTRQWIEDRRLLFWGAFAGLSFMFASIDVSGVTPIIVAVTMILLFEGTLLLLRWTGR